MFYFFRQYFLRLIHQSELGEVCHSGDCHVVAPYRSWHDLRPFAFLLAFEYFLDCLEYRGVGSFDFIVGLGMVHGCKSDIHSDLLTKILEHFIDKIFCIVNIRLPVDIHDRLHLHPLYEVLHYHNGEGVIHLG
jgi:hypothetical protein